MPETVRTRKGIGGHHSSSMRTDEWLTDPKLFKHLGPFDLDPCSPIVRPWDTAKVHYTINDDGLSQDWFGRVWMNPPYGADTGKWLDKLSLHDNGVALIFARTETSMFFKYVWGMAHSVLFVKGRLYFYTVDGIRAPANAGAPSVLVAYGALNSLYLRNCGIPGKFIPLK